MTGSISVTLAKVCTDIGIQEISARHVTPAIKVVTRAHTHTRETSFRVGHLVHEKHRERQKDIEAALEMCVTAVLAFCTRVALQGFSRCRCVAEDDQHVIGDDSKLRHQDDKASFPSIQILDRRDNFGRERKAIGGDVYDFYRTVPRVHHHHLVLFRSLCGNTESSDGNAHQRRT